MMEMEQTSERCLALGQTSVKAGLPSSTGGIVDDTASRYHGDGVRYRAKLIGMDPVPDAQGDKMCWDSMMKLKGLEEAARKQGRHKLKVWLKISCNGLKIVDERTGIVLHNHERGKISSLTKDKFEPRALAYIYQHQDRHLLFYIKMANQADPVLFDINKVCQMVDDDTSQESAEMKDISLVALNESSASTTEEAAVEDELSPKPDLSAQSNLQASSTNKLMEEPLPPIQSSSTTSQPETPQQALSTSQILSMFSTQPAGGSPYASPTFSPTSMPWALQGLQANQWGGHWPTVPGHMPTWAPLGVTASPTGGHPQSPGVVTPQAGVMPLNGYPTTFNNLNTTTGTSGRQGSPTLDSHSLL
ncbi:uncharacterized protein FYW49_007708 [Xenentodon cancila]